jgi:hypothetical protein
MRITTLAFLALATVSAPAFAGPALINGNLELPLDTPSTSDLIVGWTLVEPDLDLTGAPISSATFTSFANHTPGGDRGLWLQSFAGGVNGMNVEGGGGVNATLFQDVSAHAGVEYTLSVWFRMEANYTSQSTTLGLRFFDAGMGELASASIDLNALSPNDSVWRQFSLDAVSAPGTAFVRAFVDMTGGETAPVNPQSAFFDDFTLVPAPSAAAILAFGAVITVRRRR